MTPAISLKEMGPAQHRKKKLTPAQKRKRGEEEEEEEKEDKEEEEEKEKEENKRIGRGGSRWNRGEGMLRM